MMNRKKFLTQLGGVGAMTLLPVASVLASSKSAGINDTKKEKVISSEQGKELTVLGNKQVHKIVGKDTNNQFFEWIDYLKPGSGIPPHVHTKEDEIFRVVKGRVEFTIGTKTSVLKPGDIAFAPKNIPHAWKVIGTEEAQLSVSVYPAGIEFMFEKFDQLPPGKPDFEKVAAICANFGIKFI